MAGLSRMDKVGGSSGAGKGGGDLARDMERVGYGTLEIMRNAAGEVVFLRNTPARTIRLCKLDASVPVVRTVSRNGAEMSVTVMVRERRFREDPVRMLRAVRFAEVVVTEARPNSLRGRLLTQAELERRLQGVA